MRSLGLRIFLSFWAAMTLITATVAALYATTESPRGARRRAMTQEVVRLVAGELGPRLGPAPNDSARRDLQRASRRTGLRLSLWRSGRLELGERPGADARALVRRVDRTGRSERRDGPDGPLLAVRVAGADGVRRVLVGESPRRSAWLRALDPETLPERLLVMFLVSGLVSILLARALTRPLRTLRRAAQRMAEGDLSVRVAREIGRGGGEVLELGRDLDRMAERIETLLAAQQQLLRDVSHELRSPLARLNVALELARQKAGSEAGAPLDRIERESERLGELVGSLLTLAQLEAGVKPPRPAEIDLTALVDSIVHDADYEAGARGRRVRLVRAEPIRVRGHESLLHAAIENVVRNAVRFTADGTEVEVAVTREAGEARIEVRDRGPGVPEAALADIFRPFVRVEPDRGRNTGGTGLGLAITDRAIRQHGGSVAAENAPAGGLIVTMRLAPSPALVAPSGTG